MAAHHKSGVDFFVDVVPIRLSNGCFVCVLRDHTERRVAELALRASQQRITLATEATEIGIWEWNVHTGQGELGRFHVSYLWDPSDSRHGRDLRHVGECGSSRRSRAPRTASAQARGRLGHQPSRVPHSTAQWEVRYIEAVETIRRDREGHIDWVVGTNLDITERKNVDNSLREREWHLRQFYESKLLGVFYWNMDGHVLDANDKFLEKLGYDRSDLEAGTIDWLKMTPDEFRYLDEHSLAELKATVSIHPPSRKPISEGMGRFFPCSSREPCSMKQDLMEWRLFWTCLSASARKRNRAS